MTIAIHGGWEHCDDNNPTYDTNDLSRVTVPGGWIYKYPGGDNACLIFVPSYDSISEALGEVAQEIENITDKVDETMRLLGNGMGDDLKAIDRRLAEIGEHLRQ